MAEETGASVALHLYSLGFTDASALIGGIYGWKRAGFAVIAR